MSYRTYLYSIGNDKLHELRKLSEEELYAKYSDDKREDYEDEQTYLDCRNLWLPKMTDKCIFEYGKWSDFDVLIEPITEEIFNPDSHTFMQEHKFHTVGKEAILITIKEIKRLIAEQYQEWSDDPERGIRTFMTRASQWADKEYCGSILDLNENSKDICLSDSYEYIVFELVNLLKTFDFDNNEILFVGY